MIRVDILREDLAKAEADLELALENHCLTLKKRPNTVKF